MDIAEAEASDDTEANKQTVRRARGSHKRSDDAQNMAIEKAMAANLKTIPAPALAGSVAMLHRTFLTEAVAKTKLSAQRNFTDRESHHLKELKG